MHLTGGYYLLLQFAVSFGKRIPEMPLYALFLVPLAAVFALRMVSMASLSAPRPAQAGTWAAPFTSDGTCGQAGDEPT